MSAEGDEPAPLGEGARNVLLAARPHERLSAERKAKLHGRVMAAVAAGAGLGAAAGAAKAADVATGAASAGIGASAGVGAGAAKVAGLSLFAKIGIGVAAATISVGGVMWSRAHDEASRPVVPVTASVSEAALAPDRPVPAAREVASATPSATTDTGAAAPEGSDRPAAQASRNPSFATAEPTAEAVDPLQEETKLLAAAHAELSRGNAAAALVILDQHAARFPRGTLAPERRATRAMALCKAGRTDEGKRELAALYGADSKSPMAQKIDRACGK